MINYNLLFPQKISLIKFLKCKISPPLPAPILTMRSRSLKSNQLSSLFARSDANADADEKADSNRICTETNMPPTFPFDGVTKLQYLYLSEHHSINFVLTVQILCIGTDRSQQTVQTKIRLLLKKQSDQGLRCLPFHQHLLDALIQCYIKLFYF